MLAVMLTEICPGEGNNEPSSWCVLISGCVWWLIKLFLCQEDLCPCTVNCITLGLSHPGLVKNWKVSMTVGVANSPTATSITLQQRLTYFNDFSQVTGSVFHNTARMVPHSFSTISNIQHFRAFRPWKVSGSHFKNLHKTVKPKQPTALLMDLMSMCLHADTQPAGKHMVIKLKKLLNLFFAAPCQTYTHSQRSWSRHRHVTNFDISKPRAECCFILEFHGATDQKL